jgi:hypothetical protein
MTRNPEYQKDYEEVVKIRQQVKLSPDLINHLEKFDTMIYPAGFEEEKEEERKVCAKYGLETGCMFDPNKSFISRPEDGKCFKRHSDIWVFSSEIVVPQLSLSIFV